MLTLNETYHEAEDQDSKKLSKFDTSKYDRLTQLMFETWATLAVVRLFRLISFAGQKGMYSQRGLSTMTGIALSTVNPSLKILRDKGYITYDGTYYRATVDRTDTQNSVAQCTDNQVHKCTELQVQKCTEKQVHNIVNNTINNNKRADKDFEVEEKENTIRERDTNTDTETDPNSSFTLLTKNPSLPKPNNKLTKNKNQVKDLGVVPLFTGKLPEELSLRFAAKGYEEVFENVWMKISDYEKLEARFGEAACYAGLKAMYDWSVNEDCPKDSRTPGYKSYWKKTNHYATLKNLIMRQLGLGRVPVKTNDGYEFIYERRV